MQKKNNKMISCMYPIKIKVEARKIELFKNNMEVELGQSTLGETTLNGENMLRMKII